MMVFWDGGFHIEPEELPAELPLLGKTDRLKCKVPRLKLSAGIHASDAAAQQLNAYESFRVPQRRSKVQELIHFR